MRIERFSIAVRDEWDRFIASSKNGNFLFLRDYMDYHQDRFVDHSLLFYDDNDLVGVFPANQRDTRLDSHGGLSFGGFITRDQMKIPKMLDCFQSLLRYAHDVGFQEIRYKAIPHIYHQIPAQEDLYALHLIQARCFSRSVLTVVDTRHIVAFQNRRIRQIKTARKNGIIVQETTDLARYWQILSDLLRVIHDAKPVHSLAEIQQLATRFPENIRLFASYLDGRMLAGVLVYESSQVARTQYIAASPEGRDLGALDMIFDYLIHDRYQQKPYIEFGTSERANTENYLNVGLIDQKEGFGARAVIQDQYLIPVNLLALKILEEAYSK